MINEVIRVKDLKRMLDGVNPNLPVRVACWRNNVITDTDIVSFYNLLSMGPSYPVINGELIPRKDAVPNIFTISIEPDTRKKPIYID